MQVHFDDIVYQLQTSGGISNYWKEVTSRIVQFPEVKITRTEGRKLARYLPVASRADIFHSSYYRQPLAGKNTKNVVTIYDFIYELGFIKTLGKGINTWQISQAINRADAIICISENTKKDLERFYPHVSKYAAVYAIKLGTSLASQPVDLKSISARVSELVRDWEKRYVLFVGNRKYHKNFRGAIAGFAQSSLPQKGYLMTCVGAKFDDAEVELIESLGLTGKAIALEGINAAELRTLYQNAFTLVYPSFYEGFGLPPLEAMSCGCPAIAANTSSIPEVVGDGGILINPNDSADIASALESLLDRDIRNLYIQRGLARSELFSWDECARKHIEVYQSLID